MKGGEYLQVLIVALLRLQERLRLDGCIEVMPFGHEPCMATRLEHQNQRGVTLGLWQQRNHD
ncbi:hypothetical protein GCM10011247_26100 [Pseudomonas plecoglossicida]|nr:hypothetical protein GCM10011247_26100 [Pseudomonas plecoglossicida]